MTVRGDDGSLVTRTWLVVPQTDPRPVPPTTGRAVEGCYAGCLQDCDGELEGEHFISHRMLKLLAGDKKTLKVRGIDPADQDLERHVGTKHLIARALCARHNRVLKPIDTAGNRFFEAISSLPKRLQEEPAGTKNVVAINGHDLERWCLKALCGFLARAGKPVPELWIRILFGRRSIIRPHGLYVYAEPGDVFNGDKIGLEEIRFKDEGPVGVIIKLLSHELVFSMSNDVPITLQHHVPKLRVFRPEVFNMTNAANGSEFALFLSWQDFIIHAEIASKWSADDPRT
jgi:hypothetical protein